MNIKVFSLLLFFNISHTQENRDTWKALKESAHEIGFCVYNVNESFCDEHKIAKAKYEEEASEEEDVNYFVMKEEWAKKRMKDWAVKQALDENALLLVFDIDQGYENRERKSYLKPNYKYFILNLKDNLEFKIEKRSKKKVFRCTISHKQKPNMLENSLWREFMTGRFGLLKKSVEFNVFSKSKVKRRLKSFKRHFQTYKIRYLD